MTPARAYHPKEANSEHGGPSLLGEAYVDATLVIHVGRLVNPFIIPDDSTVRTTLPIDVIQPSCLIELGIDSL
jgi:hypothetical protein